MIKNNIDLTENEIFSKDVRTEFKEVLSYIQGRFPWYIRQFTEIKNDSDFYKFEPIPLGNKETRERKRVAVDCFEMEVQGVFKHCYCCGKKIHNIQWKFENNTLCPNCEKRLEKDVSKSAKHHKRLTDKNSMFLKDVSNYKNSEILSWN